MYSQIPKVFENWENYVKERQSMKILLQITEFQDKTSEKGLFYRVTLTDLEYCVKSLFFGDAAFKLQKQIQANDQQKQNKSLFGNDLLKPGIIIHEWDICEDIQQPWLRVWDCDFQMTGSPTTARLKDFYFSKKSRKLKIKNKSFIEKSFHSLQAGYLTVKHEMSESDKYQEEFELAEVLNQSQIQPDLIIKRDGNLKIAQVLNNSFSNPPTTVNTQFASYQRQIYNTIRDLKFKQNFRIQGRIMDKYTSIETVQNKKGEWDEFKIIVMDKNCDFIKVTFYSDACLKYFDRCNIQSTYEFYNGQVKEVLGSLQINFKKWSQMREIEEDFSIPNYPKLGNAMVPIGTINKDFADCEVDLIAVIHEIIQQGSIKICILADQTGSIKAMLFNTQLKFERKSNLVRGTVVAIHKAVVSLYKNTLCLKINDTTLILPCRTNYKQKDDLDKWYQLNGQTIEVNIAPIITNYCTIQELYQLTDEAIGNQTLDNCITKKIRGVLFSIQLRNYLYPSCPYDNKKMQYISNTKMYYCNKCLQDTSNPKYSFLLNASILDSTSRIDVTIFNDQATKMMDFEASEFKDLLPEQQHRLLNGIILIGEFEIQMTIQEGDIKTPKFQLLKYEKRIDYADWAKQNFSIIEKQIWMQTQRQPKICF